ncbi:MAG: hypothetical protein HGA93_05270, partial [Methanothrix sp.]|nr:hypothetical protein [Methanothrix sp.]
MRGGSGMHKRTILVAVILVLALICPVLADDPVPDDIQISVADPVLVANGMDTTVVSITVKNQSVPIPGLAVEFIVNDGNLGSVTPASTTTSAGGLAESTFTVKKIAGTAEVSARVSYTIGGTVYTQTVLIGEIEIQDPIPDIIDFYTSEEWLVANGDWGGDCANWRDFYNPASSGTILYEQMNGTGPFAFDYWAHGSEVSLVRN